MIGLGKWLFHVDTMLFKGDATVKIFDRDGKYGFDLDVTGVDIPEFSVTSITEDGDTLNAIATTDLMPGREIPISITFEDGVANGFVKAPMIGKIKLKDGKKVG